MGDGVVVGDAAVEVGLPVLSEDAEIIFPAAFVEAFAHGIGNIARRRVAGVSASEGERANDFAGGIEKQSVPKIARDGFFALATFAVDGVLHAVGDAVRSLVEKDFEGFGALVARVGAGDGHAKRIECGVSAGGAGVGGDIDADSFFGPVGLVDFGESMRKIKTIAANQRRDRDLGKGARDRQVPRRPAFR